MIYQFIVSPMNIQFIKSLIICNLLALLIGNSVIAILKMVNRKENKFGLGVSNGILLLMIVYFSSVAALTIVPLPFSSTGQHLRTGINLVPVINTFDNLVQPMRQRHRLLASDVLENIIGNIIMFMPLGILLPMAFQKFANYKWICTIAFFGSVLIEITQLLSRSIGNYRQVDIDDVILNTAGAIAGYYIYEKWIAGNGAKRSDAWFGKQDQFD